MGRDKASLGYGGRTLLERVAGTVAEATARVTLIGDPSRYAGFGYPVVPDTFPGLGPLAGIHAALSAARSNWNLIVACDMPALNAPFLRELFDSLTDETDCLLPAGPSGRPEPLCGIYHRRALPAIEEKLRGGVRKVLDGLASLRVTILPVVEDRCFRNLNTPEDWMEYLQAQVSKTPADTI
jgi:molybdopterin-guanine dinucleotide biosynthesis protein A